MKPLVIFGAGEIAELADFYFSKVLGRVVAAFTVDAAYLGSGSLGGRPVVAFEEIAAGFPAADHEAFAALSYAKMNDVRAEKTRALKALGYRLASYISPRATNYAESIGDNCFILEDNTIQPFVRIGDNVTLWSGNHIGHHAVIEDNVFISSHVVISGGVRVGANSFLGVNATVGDHVILAPYTMLGAGALVVGDTETEGVYTTPASEKRKLSSRRLKL
jgi:sugar O-acyltransferase (sialic acid O-acetyltransferase NeuD family)